MGEQYLSWTEIQKKYPKEWVLLDKVTTKWRRPEVVTGGVVVLHCPDHAEFIRRTWDFPEVVRGAFLYTGPDELDLEIVET
jgi:hypothetical protein